MNAPTVIVRTYKEYDLDDESVKFCSPWGPGGLVENVSSVSPTCRKRRLNGSVSRNNCVKRLAPCRCLDGHVKEPYEMSMALGARP